MSQQTFMSLEFEGRKKQTRREKFLSEMEDVVPWLELVALIEPHYPKAGNGRRPLPLEMMLRIHFMQQWFDLSDPGMEEALYDSYSLQRFAGIELGRDAVPDETTILHFRHLLERHGLTEKIFQTVRALLVEKGQILRQGTIVDATIITAASSTKNREKSRDGEMSSTKKGQAWYFGMKAHIGVDSRSGLAHSVVCGTASEHDSQRLDELLHGEEKEIYGDKAYDKEGRKTQSRAEGVKWRVTIKAHRGRPLTNQEETWNKSRNRVRAKVEHLFGVVKNLWGYRKVRYRGLYKNQCQIQTLVALANLYLARNRPLKRQLARA
jgi:IS5 family transposase